MQEAEFQKKMTELMGEIQTLPDAERERLEKLAAETRQRHEQLRKTMANLQENLDQLRLGIKYLIFDLEATKRENAQLKRMVDGRSEEAQ
jgi:hypothetical protein